jgi:cell division septation protein DedD
LLGALPPEDAPKTDIASAPGSAGRFTVQLGAFTLEVTARKLARAFAAKGYAVSVTRVRERFAVRTGAFASADEAAAAIPQLKKVAAVQPLVLRRSATLAATAPTPGA